MSDTIDETKRRIEVSRSMFEDRLRYFVGRWAPDDRLDREEFQMELMRLFVGAMWHQSAVLGLGIEHYAAEQFRNRSLDPLRVIMEEPKKP